MKYRSFTLYIAALWSIILLPFLTACRKTPVLTPEWEQAQWIGIDAPDSTYRGREGHSMLAARHLRYVFTVDTLPLDARLFVAAGGFSDTYVNGKKVTNDVLGPLPSDYDKTVYFCEYDVTSLLRKGQDTILICLSPGWFTAMLGDYGMRHWGTPRALAQLVVRTKGGIMRLSTDSTWQATNCGPVRRSNLYDGEYYDAHYENPEQWQQAEVLEAPNGILRRQNIAGQQILDTIRPLSIRRTIKNTYIVDMGQNMVGWLQLQGQGNDTTPVVIRMAETLLPDSMGLYTANLRDARATNTYIPRDNQPFVYCPSTTWQGFRYAEISGLSQAPDKVVGFIIADKMRRTGSFHCSDSLLNRLFRAAENGIRGNYHGFPTDCPQRDERLGWLGDRFTGAYGESYLFDNQDLYLKWMQDIEDSQTEEGQLSDIAPRYWGIRHHKNVTWNGTYISVANMLWERFGNEEGIRRHYDSMRKWVLYTVQETMVDSLLTVDTYGDWCMPPERPELIHSKDPARQTEATVLSTTVFYDLLGKMQQFALLLGRDSDCTEYAQLAQGIRRNYNRRFYHPETGSYSNNTVTANILSLALGLVPEGEEERVMAQIVKVTEKDFHGHVSCGVLGIQYLMRTLTRWGHADLAMKIARQTSYPSWGYMLEHGATTIWELWNGNSAAPEMNSGNHVMLLGDLLLWYYEDLAGIRPDQPGYQHLHMQPVFPEELNHVEARYESVSGTITSEWGRHQDGSVSWLINLPKGVKATVVLPDKTTKEIHGNATFHFRQK